MDAVKVLKLRKVYELYLEYLEKKSGRRRWWIRPINRQRNELGYFKVTFLEMKYNDHDDFFKYTRMTRVCYDLLLNILNDDLQSFKGKYGISKECKLAITLSHLARGTTISDLSWSYKIGYTTVRGIILETCEIIWKILQPLYVTEPSTHDYHLITEEFNSKWNLPNCVGAIDGKHISLQAPPLSGSMFFNYKKDFSIVLMAACDANYTFRYCALGAYGSQSDGGIFKNAKFGQQIIIGSLPPLKNSVLPKSVIEFPHYFVADAAFPLKTNLMRPYPGKNLTPERRIYNYRISRARRVIENAFGISVARWRVLRQTMSFYPENAEKIVLACISLHNFIKLNDSTKTFIPSTYADWEDEEHVLHEGEWRNEVAALPSISSNFSNRSDQTAFRLRDALKDYLNKEGSVPFQASRC